MSTRILLAILSVLVTVAAAARAGADDLFSTLRLDSTSSSTGAPQEGPAPPRSLSDAFAVQTLLLAAGYNARVDEHETLRFEISRGEWTAPVVIGLADGGRQWRMALRLTEPEANTVIAARTLREMLEANRSNWGGFFAIAGEPQRIELVKTISNNGLDAEQFREELDKLAEMADKTQTIWKSEGVRIRKAAENTQTESDQGEVYDAATPSPKAVPPTQPEAKPASPTAAPPQAQQAAPAASSLTGKWIATSNTNEAFALQMDTDSSFKLVHVKGTKSSKSKGNWTLAGSSLSLKGDDGTTITGTVALTTGSFTLTIAGAGGKSTTLTFKSGS